MKGGYGVHGVYLDDCLSGVAVTDNVIYDVSGYGIQHGGGRDKTPLARQPGSPIPALQGSNPTPFALIGIQP